jgi:hypothetical protein
VVVLILIISVVIVGVISLGLGRWLQRKGAAMERHRDEPPR